MAVKQTAGRRDLGEFAPKFAEPNDAFAQYFSKGLRKLRENSK